jgi:hypothetical protein
MTLQASGAISLGNIQTEFTGSNPISMSEYVRGGTYVPNTATNVNIKSSASNMSFSNYYGGSVVSFTPTTRTYSSGSGTETIPSGATQVVIEVWGAGGGGGRGRSSNATYGGGGGAGGYSKKTYTLSSGNWGTTFSYGIGAGGTASTIANGGDAGLSIVTNGTFPTSTSIAGEGGVGGLHGLSGGDQGAGGAATGGDVNTYGNGGSPTTYFGAASPNGGVRQDTLGAAGNVPGGGGAGGDYVGNLNGGQGASGRVKFTYT